MANIIPKLNLNKTPHLVDNNSLIFAKNIRLDSDGNIHKDYGISSLLTNYIRKNDVLYKHLYSEIAYRLLDDIDKYVNDLLNQGQPIPDIYNPWTEDDTKDSYYTILRYIVDEQFLETRRQAYFIEKDFNIVGVIPDNNAFYLFCVGFITYADITNNNNNNNNESISASGSYHISFIVKYDEEDANHKFSICNCNWKYSGGVIEGCVVNNLTGDTILNIGETKDDNTLIPFKCINLNKSSYTDDESIYTQISNIPITNLNFNGTFDYVIPNGTYQFFIRYKIRENFYTDWFPASREVFAANKESEVTNFGTITKVDTNKDSNYSFIFNVDHLFLQYITLYESFQIGFILTHDNATYGRAWKHFNFNTSVIKFDYNANDATEIEVVEFIKPTYGIYNVKNITSFKNKLYISNYIESNFNENLQNIANNINIDIRTKQSGSGYGDYDVETTNVGGKTYISAIKIPVSQSQTVTKHFNGSGGIIEELMNISVDDTTMYNIIFDSIIRNKDFANLETSEYDFIARLHKDSLTEIQDEIKNNIESQSNFDPTVQNCGPKFSDTIHRITVNDVFCSNMEAAINKIYDTIYYLNYNGEFINKNNIPQNTIVIKIYRNYTWKYFTEEPIDENNTRPRIRALANRIDEGTGYRRVYHDSTVQYSQTIKITFKANPSLINEQNISPFKHYTTLIPYQKYKFYIHFVKQTGETTNGYFCNGVNAGEIEVPYQPTADRLIYPVFDNIVIPDGYVACFFSIFHSAVYSASVFLNRYTKDNNTYIEGRCFDVNARLLPFTSLINCRQDVITNNDNIQNNVKGRYHYSSDSSEGRYFGADGIISFDADNQSSTEYNTFIDNFNANNPNLLYALTDYQSQKDIDVELVKCTPFIKKRGEYDNYIDLNLLGYLCTLPPLNTDRVTQYFSDGSNVYEKDIAGSGSHRIQLKELGKYLDSDPRIIDFPIVASENVNVYSNFNIQYFSTIEDTIPKVSTYYNRRSTDPDDENSNVAIYWKLLKSLTLADFYTLHSMYKDYIRKTYSVYDEKAIIKFDNTIRSSILIDDESEISIFRFNPDDSYNIPTNRGIIVNLLSIGDAILVHTKDSMFKFSGTNTLSGSTGEITTQETEVFDTGVSEIFGSDFGFAGLQNKKDAITTQNGYIFFDRDAKIIYMYSGQNQIIKLSDSIEKLFNYDTIVNIAFANDFYNNRFFVCIMFTNSKSITLSFNFLNNSKSFISLHDFKFDIAFNTKTNCYFIDGYRKNICYIDKTIFGIYNILYTLDGYIYPNKYTQNTEQVYYDRDTTKLVDNPYYVYSAIVDVIFNAGYETVKTLNNIEWCGSIIDKIFKEIDNTDITTLMIAEPTQENHPCTYLRIYSDTCLTDLIDCRQRSNDNRLDRATQQPNKNLIHNQLDSYKYPRYNQGKWTLNYFRNILNANDLDKSNENYDNGRNHDNTSLVDNRFKYISDQHSLIEGKYFVIRFIFDDNADFRLESLTINGTNKL